MISVKNFKGPQGIYLTKALFLETYVYDKNTVLYTLKPEDTENYPSLKKLYLNEEDPSEYNFANKHLANWEHWSKLQECEWFKPHIDLWRYELELQLKAKAFKNIFLEASDESSKNSFAANRYILEGYNKMFSKEEKNKRGRPSNDEVKKIALEMALDREAMEKDYERISKGVLQ